VVVRHFNIVSIAVLPRETNSVLIIDPNTILSLAITLQNLQAVSSQYGKIGDSAGRIDHAKLLESRPGAALKSSALSARK
jgi:hypothetical protein